MQTKIKLSTSLKAVHAIPLILLFIFTPLLFESCGTKKEKNTQESVEIVEPIILTPKVLYDINVDSLLIERGQVKRNQFLADILLDKGVNYAVIDHIAKTHRSVFDVRKIRAGNSYTIISANDSITSPLYFVYEIDNTDYVVYNLSDSLTARRGYKPVERRLESAYGTINSSLWNAMVDGGFDPNLANELSEVYAWTIDFFGIQKGDEFEVLFDRLYVEGNPIGIGKIKASRFQHYGKDQLAFYFEQDSVGDYFDENGQSLMRTFLKAPLKYNRISSGFSNARFHPVLKIYRPHHGVDYAAPSGTPVFAIGEGTVTRKGYQKGGGGNYLYIKHNGTYTTAYMHLKGFAKGIVQGTRVKQGQLIGYVGSTGLSTGPHLDFRFFRNGNAVNPLKVESPPAKPVDTTHMEQYQIHLKKWLPRLNQLRDSVNLVRNKEQVIEEKAVNNLS
ncbi:MAG: peptidoglycan DD-metalloendopeptidase family protein [Bacteroidetes bacterium]|jgi:murein DD-endopeptidase MepM/ murein hydrolase activator NlpD|nr:peptidoglycan DD-metalloendopeptidase family protein [Bacteroidota bacterium]